MGTERTNVGAMVLMLLLVISILNFYCGWKLNIYPSYHSALLFIHPSHQTFLSLCSFIQSPRLPNHSYNFQDYLFFNNSITSLTE
jgi:hypothetical protein